MAKFQCLVSGNFVEFKDENDIKDMLTHPQYKLYVDTFASSSIAKPVKEVKAVQPIAKAISKE